jgi:formate hydrogenlyase transcriptional activator
VVERAVILSPGPALVVQLAEMERHPIKEPGSGTAPLRPTRRRPVRSILADVDREQIIRALKEADGQVGGPDGAAARLRLKRTTFITRMKKLGIDPSTVSEKSHRDRDTSDAPDTSRALLPPLDVSPAE